MQDLGASLKFADRTFIGLNINIVPKLALVYYAISTKCPFANDAARSGKSFRTFGTRRWRNSKLVIFEN
jgi:hypothetical protein